MNLKKWKYIIVTSVSIILMLFSCSYFEAGMGEGAFVAFFVFLIGLGILILFGLWDIFQHWKKKHIQGLKQELEIRFQKVHKVRILTGGALLILGGILPWRIKFSMNYETWEIGGGFDYGGMITSGIGLLIIIVALLREGRIGTVVPETAIILSCITLLLVLYIWLTIANNSIPFVGLILTILGVALLLWGGFGILSYQRKW